MTELRIIRTKDDGEQTRGHLVVMRNGIAQYACLTLELPWKCNERRVSCIPTGTYIARKHRSPKFGQSVHILDVPGRSEILIHPANYAHQLLGCIAPGLHSIDINGDGKEDVTASRWVMENLLKALPNEFNVHIINEKEHVG